MMMVTTLCLWWMPCRTIILITITEAHYPPLVVEEEIEITSWHFTIRSPAKENLLPQPVGAATTTPQQQQRNTDKKKVRLQARAAAALPHRILII